MKKNYPNLLSPIKVGKFILKNRMQSSNSFPHFSQGPEEFPADATMAHFLGRAKGGAAFITLAAVEDTYNSKPMPDFIDVSHFPEFNMRDPKCQNYMVELVEAMHSMGTLVSGSLFSANRTYRYENEKGEVEAVSANAGSKQLFGTVIDDSIPTENLYKIIKSYGQRTALYKRLGFDAVTVHMSYRAQIPGQLLSPLSNSRTDEFGGSFENRIRFAKLMLEEIRKVAGKDMLIEIQFSGEEIEGGYDLQEGIKILRELEDLVDIVQVRSPEGNPNHPIPFELQHTPFLELAATIKKEGFNFLVSNVGGFFYPEEAEAAIKEGKLDLVAMARSWISNPDYISFLYDDKREDLVPCLRCNKCHGRSKGDVFTTTCSVNPHFGLEAVEKHMIKPVTTIKNIAVIGGGPGGMRTAMYLADRGHQVTIFEAKSELGGAIVHADYVDFKWTLKEYKDYLIKQVNKRNIEVVLNTKVKPEDIQGKYDTVIVAIGAKPFIPAIEGVNQEHVILATDALVGAKEVGKKVVVIGGGEVGVETGMHFAQKGHDVTVIEMRKDLAMDATAIHYREMFKTAWESIENFHSIVNATCKKINENTITYITNEGIENTIEADTVILSVGMRDQVDQALAFADAAPEFYMVGDCKKPGTIQTTNRNAFGIANII